MKSKVSLKTSWILWRARLSLPAILAKYSDKTVQIFFSAINAGAAIFSIGLFAWLTHLPLIFPTLGPSAFLLFSNPLSAAAAPRSVILSHSLALAIGYGTWLLFHFLYPESLSLVEGHLAVYFCATLALALTAMTLIYLNCPHAPGCASSLVVALGLVTQWQDICLMIAVIVWLTAQAYSINRLAGLPVPLWSARKVY